MNRKGSSESQSEVEVKIYSFQEVLQLDCPLELDNYQRAFVWGKDKIEQLVQDLYEFTQQNKENLTDPQYYMGALLLHKNIEQGKFFVIDGQQRMTSLSILYWLLNKELPPNIKFVYRSTRSAVNIQHAKQVMFECLKKCQLSLDIFKHLRFTAITVEREDLAFTFFDTQNNRGVPISGTDLLKAYHLRAINDENIAKEEQLQSHCAKRWEKVQFQCSKEDDFAPELFHYYLWRSRNWMGSQVTELESQDELLSHFGKQSICESDREITLYPAVNNQWGKALWLTDSNEYQIQPSSQILSGNAACLPMSIRQPISRGVGFFLYAEKYASLLDTLLYKPSTEPEIIVVQDFFSRVVSKLSAYLQSLYKLACLAYIDQLGNRGLLRFLLWLDHQLGAIRLSQDDIRRETPIKFLRDEKRNLIDVICHAFRCEDIVNYLQQKNVSDIYQKNEGWCKQIQDDRLVQERYVAALARFYGVNTLSTKESFIDCFVKNKLGHA